MSCRHYCINYSKKSFLKTFSFHKIIYKYFAGFLACIKSSLRGYCRSNPQKRNFIILDCFTRQRRAFSPVRNDRYKKQSRNNGKNIVITREWNDRSNPICAYCFASRCAPHGDDYNKNFQFDKFQRLFSVIYKKNSLTKEISK